MMPPGIIVDTHVHLHPRFGVEAFLDSAATNLGPGGVLCLTESAGVDRFEELRQAGRAGAWTIHPTAEPESLVARAGERAVVLIAGRQIVTAERVEVLALGTAESIADGMALGATLDAAVAVGAVPVLPWGVGKWWGARGRLVAEALATRTGVCLGDQAGRPRGAAEHPLFRVARERGVHILPGSDPLDLDHHIARPGSYGLLLDRPLDADRPSQDLKARIRALAGSPPAAGRRAGWVGCLRDQALLRVLGRTGGRTGGQA